MHISVLLGRKVEVQVQGLTENIDGRDGGATAAEGLPTEGELCTHALIGQQLVFDNAVVVLQQIVRLNEARHEGALVVYRDRIAQGGRLALLALCLGGAALLLPPSGFGLGGGLLGRQDLVGAQGDHDGLTDAKLVLGKLFLVVHQAGYRHRLAVLGIVHAVILKLLLGEVGGEVGIDVTKMLGGKKLAIRALAHDAVEELRVLQRNGRVQIADVVVGRHLGIGIAAHRIARLVTALDILPKQ